MKLKNYLCLLAAGLLFSTPVMAEEINPDENKQVLMTNENSEAMLHEEFKFNEFYRSNPVFSSEVAKEVQQSDNVANLTVGDIYEPNNSPETATIGAYDNLVKASLHQNDADWYRIDVTTTDVYNKTDYSFILNNIPAGCNYDLYLVTYIDGELQGLVSNQTSNIPEQMYLTFNTQGTYYVVVQSAFGYKDSEYSLYFGKSYKKKTTGYMNTGLEFDFGRTPQGNTMDIYSKKLTYDLTNASDIPDGSIMERFNLTSDGNGGYWIGFRKYLNGFRQLGNIDLMDLPYQNNYAVKQTYYIQGSIVHSANFIWKPRVSIEYRYPVTLSNFHFLYN